MDLMATNRHSQPLEIFNLLYIHQFKFGPVLAALNERLDT